MSAVLLDADVLDDPERLNAADPGGMLRAAAGGGAQVRESLRAAEEAGLGFLAGQRPRAIVICGMGGSGIAGDVLAGVAGLAAPVPIVTHRNYGLPGWVGVSDLVVAVSCSGSTEETLSAADEARRRGAELLAIGAASSPLEEHCGHARGLFVPVPGGRPPRGSLWALATPLLVLGDALGLLDGSRERLEATADLLDEISDRCRPSSESFVNPAKTLALELGGTVPMVWGSSPLAGVAAYRMVCQLAENAKLPGIAGELPEANHNAVEVLDGPLARSGGGDGSLDRIFADPVDNPPTGAALRLLVLRDRDEHPQLAKRAEATLALAEQRGLPAGSLTAEGNAPVERLASLIGLTDFATVYLALLMGTDPTPVPALDELKGRISS